METTLIVVLFIGGVLLVAAVAWALGRSERRPHRAPPPDGARRREIVVDVGATAPDSPAVERLVQRTAEAAFRESPELEEVVVKNRDGTILGVRRRPQPLPKVTAPRQLPRAHKATGPRVVPKESHPLPPIGDPPEQPRRAVADRYDLPAAVLERVVDPDDPVAVVRAILLSGGRPVEALAGGDLRSADTYISVIGYRGGRPGQKSVLNDIYLRFQASGASIGIVISLEHVSTSDVRRRELLAPS